ncbi:glycerol kinase GlpK [Verrucomicrobiaceae bacterium N1E253]|uniref:Glycerol kinase n=1 Tax=Oceaniferula marina TaxID=2748318 RepID=A0A851GJP5_9BACT|nr:glycerol kinase GlpK [Oceaniferula marina]NWK57556.1 glycerol kinase GlpK [Oceaniferula marina]
MSRFVLSLDQGTTSSRAILFDTSGNPVASEQEEFAQIFPKPGWVEHDAMEIWRCQSAVADAVMQKAKVTAADVAAIGITNQRETTVVWNRETGKPIHNAIVWQDRRTAGKIDQLVADGNGDQIRAKTGLMPDAYFSGSKVAWILDHVPGARESARRGLLAFGTIDSWLVYQLTKGRVHITDPSNASRTMLYNIHTLDWDDALLDMFRVPRSMLPEVRESSEVYAEVEVDMLCRGVPIAGIAGDQHAALFGQNCFKKGALKNTYGTGCFMLVNTGDKPTVSQNRLLTTIAWKRKEQVKYALEGSVFIGGAVVQWLRDGLGMIKKSSDIRGLCDSVEDSGGVVMVPALAGLGAPHWDQYARGAIFGLTRGTTTAHIARAAVESMAFQSADLLTAMQADTDFKISQLHVDGGAAIDDFLLQFQADILQLPIVRPKMFETTALGAAYLAGLATGVWRDTAELEKNWQVDRIFEPQIAPYEAAEKKAVWNEAVKRSMHWEKPEK